MIPTGQYLIPSKAGLEGVRNSLRCEYASKHSEVINPVTLRLLQSSPLGEYFWMGGQREIEGRAEMSD